MSELPPERKDALYYRVLPDGRDIAVYEHNQRQFAVGVSQQGSGVITSNFYYYTRDAALAAAAEWNGEGDAPVGWFRHPRSGRRREDGDTSKEYYQP